jgi:hypothetical protein
MSYPSVLSKTGGTWQTRTHEYRKVTSVQYTNQPQSTSNETLYVLWVDELNAGSWHTNGYHHDSEIKVTHATDVWSDAGTSAPTVDSNTSTSTHINLRNVAGGNLLYQFAKPASGPTVTSITATKIFVPSDTVSNTDFTLLQNGSSYSNTNISLTGPGAQPPSDARGYTYSLSSTATHVTGNYNFTIDSKSITNFHYDDSWTSSPSSGRSTNSNRILNVIASIPATTTFGSGTDLNGNPNALTTTHFPSGRRIRHTTAIYENNVHTINFFLDFAVSQKIINGTSEIVGTFYEIKEDANGSNATFNQSSDHIIGDNATMTYTRTLFGDSIDYIITDWVYSDEPEGDGYVAPVTTTSNGGGKPDRYPLIMTNLFNRNRSLYSIGMTHKDTWDLFL